MKYSNNFERSYHQETAVLTSEEQIAMDIVASNPTDTPVQELFRQAHRQVYGSYRRNQVKKEIYIFLNRLRGIASYRNDYNDKDVDFEDSLGDLASDIKTTKKRAKASGEKLKSLIMRRKLGIMRGTKI